MGQHDFVATVELPNDESAMSVLLALGGQEMFVLRHLKNFHYLK